MTRDHIAYTSLEYEGRIPAIIMCCMGLMRFSIHNAFIISICHIEIVLPYLGQETTLSKTQMCISTLIHLCLDITCHYHHHHHHHHHHRHHHHHHHYSKSFLSSLLTSNKRAGKCSTSTKYFCSNKTIAGSNYIKKHILHNAKIIDVTIIKYLNVNIVASAKLALRNLISGNLSM